MTRGIWLVVEGAALAMFLACGGTGGGSSPPSPPAPPNIAADPASLTIATCGSATFAVLATGTPPLTYQWFEDGAPIPGATGPSYVIARAGPAESGAIYSVVVTNAGGSATSAGATLTVVDTGGPIVLAEGRVFGGMAVDGTSVYWTDGLGVSAASINCSGPVRSLYERVSFTENTNAMVLAPDRVVWTDQAGGAIRSVPADGGTSKTLASELGNGGPYVLALTGEQLLWPNLTHGIQTVPLGGGPVTTFPVGDPPLSAGGIAADDLYVYWTDLQQRTVNRMPLGGGPVVVLASGQDYPNGIAADGQAVYWTSAAHWNTVQPTGYIMRVSRHGGVPVVLASQATLTHQLAIDGSSVYWTGGLFGPDSAGTGSVTRVPLDGSEPATVLVSGLNSPFDIAVDSRYVYWSEERGIMRLEKGAAARAQAFAGAQQWFEQFLPSRSSP